MDQPREKPRWLSSRFFVKLVVFGFALGCVPTVVVGLFAYRISAGITRDRILEGNAQALHQVASHAEYVLMNTDTSLRQFAESAAANQALESDLSGADFEIFQEVSKRLSTVAPPEILNADACMVNYARGWAISGSGLYRLGEPENAVYGELERLPNPSVWVTRLDSRQPASQPFGSFFHGDAVYLVKAMPLNFISATSVCVVKIPCGYLGNLPGMAAGNTVATILDGDFQVVGSGEPGVLGEDWSETALAHALAQKADRTGQFQLPLEQATVSVCYWRSEYNGWHYLSLTPVGDIASASRAIGWFTALVTGICLFTVLLLSILVSRKMYRPISRVYHSLGPLEAGEEGGDELYFIGSRISSLLADQEQLETQMSWQEQQLQEFYAIKILLGNLGGRELEEKLSVAGRPGTCRWKCVLVLQMDAQEDAASWKEDNLTLFALNNITEELLREEYLLMPVPIRRSIVVAVGGGQESYGAFRDRMYARAEEIQSAVNRYFSLQVSIGISRQFERFEEAHRAYLEGVEALKYRIRLGRNAILFYEDVQPGQAVVSLTYLQVQKRLVEAFRAPDEEAVAALLDAFLQEVLASDASPLELQIPLAGLLTELVAVIRELNAGYQIPAGEGAALFDQLFALQTPDEIAVWFHGVIIDPFLCSYREKNDSHIRAIAGQLMEMIEREYDRELSIESCSRRLCYHSTYLRRVFLRVYGVNFGEQLTRRRMEAAQELLRDTNMRVLDIARKLQYANAQNFIRTFKKYKGMTPGQYRDSLSRGG